MMGIMASMRCRMPTLSTVLIFLGIILITRCGEDFKPHLSSDADLPLCRDRHSTAHLRRLKLYGGTASDYSSESIGFPAKAHRGVSPPLTSGRERPSKRAAGDQYKKEGAASGGRLPSAPPGRSDPPLRVTFSPSADPPPRPSESRARSDRTHAPARARALTAARLSVEA